MIVHIIELKKLFIDDVLKFYKNLKIITFKAFNYHENRVNRM